LQVGPSGALKRGVIVKKIAGALIGAVLSLVASGSLGGQEIGGQEIPHEISDGWFSLFNGNSLTGWRGYRSKQVGTGWKAEDGVLTRVESGAGDLVTIADFQDFELQLDWRISKGGNSGILYRVGLDANETYESGPEYQVLDNATETHPEYTAAALYELVAPSEDRTRNVGEWNEARIIVRGWHIQHWLNGYKVVDIDLASPYGKELLKNSKFNQMPKFATSLRGHIALQDHGNEVSFRNIRIREFK
jgi:3-keto-disaccharide hydrolase